ncbi:hypothetical protein D1872_228650 [compost metagenome]
MFQKVAVGLIRVGVIDEQRLARGDREPDEPGIGRDPKLPNPVSGRGPQFISLTVEQPDGTAVGPDHPPPQVGHMHQNPVKVTLVGDPGRILENHSQQRFRVGLLHQPVLLRIHMPAPSFRITVFFLSPRYFIALRRTKHFFAGILREIFHY